ncbi:hypothetical protein ACU686_11255 [Yinghuangia aomiensis]
MAGLLADGPETGVPALYEALDLLTGEKLGTREATVRWLLLAPVAIESFIHHAWDLHAWDALSSRAVRLARDIGALGALPPALIYAGGVHIHYGEFAKADRMIDEADAIAEATGHAPHKYATLVLAAWRGEADIAAAIVEETRESAVQRASVPARRHGLHPRRALQRPGTLRRGHGGGPDGDRARRVQLHRTFLGGAHRGGHPLRRGRPGPRLAGPADGTHAGADRDGPEERPPAAGRSSPTATRPTASTAPRSRSSAAAGWSWKSRVPTFCTASGCAAAGAAPGRTPARPRDVREDAGSAFAERARRELLATGEHVTARRPRTRAILRRRRRRSRPLPRTA